MKKLAKILISNAIILRSNHKWTFINFKLNFTYYISLISLFIFGCLFFSFDLYTKKLKELKGNRLLFQSKVYLDSSIDNAGGLLASGVRKARIALLLNPQNGEAEENYLNLLAT